MDKPSAMTEASRDAAESNGITGALGTTKSTTSVPSSAASINGQISKQSSATTSTTHSPAVSRESSPIRQARRATSSSRLSGNRSRKNSQQESSPSRQIRPIPTSNPSTRSLSSTTIPTLLPRETQVQSHTPQKSSVTSDPKDGPRWPISPRLRSPPPQLIKPGVSRRADQDAPIINVQRPSPSPHPSETQVTPGGSDTEDSQLHSGVRTPVRGALETVQEVSQNNSPMTVRDSSLLEQVKEKLFTENRSDSAINDADRTLKARPSLPNHESGSESGGTRAESRRTTSVPPPLTSRQSSSMSTKPTKSKAEGSTQTMTVETETVSSIPQVALATGTKTEGVNGSLKTKPSTETIRPKKEKKKTRKQTPVTSGNASSKADIFEAKIASAVDEANTSDSEETFVYDSNPPDSGDRTVRRFHSRTPSATSMVSQADRQNLRSIYGVMENGPTSAPAPKKSMKFANTFNGTGGDSLAPGDDDGKGTGRSAGGSGRGTVRHHHHIGRWGRQPGNGHPSLFDNESPFPNAAKPKFTGQNTRNSSGPTSPRTQHSARGHLNTKRSAIQLSSSYDLDDTTGADDERAPLLNSNRRNGRSRRGPHSLRQAESQTYTRRSSYLNRFAACLVLTMMFLLVITGAIGFMFATSQPMTGIEITSISNVVTSEQVLMFDLTVKAHNPNIVVVTIDHSNLEVFAKSEHAGTGSDWRKYHESRERSSGAHASTTEAPGGDPSEDDELKPNILLGRVTDFDSPLTFEGSLFHQGTSSSTGEMQLANPGNGTTGGAERWERIFQNEFDLIIKGVVKYNLPLSARIRSATVSGRTTVKPNSANNPVLKPNTTTSHNTS